MGIPIVTTVTREYSWMISPLEYLVEKYTQSRLICISDVDIPGIKTIVVHDWDWWAGYGKGLKAGLQLIEDPVILLLLADMWPCAYAASIRLEILADYLLGSPYYRIGVGDNPSIMYPSIGKLAGTPCEIQLRTVSTVDAEFGFYGGFLLHPSLWDRKRLIGAMIEETSLWNWEELHIHKMRPYEPVAAWPIVSVLPFAHVLGRSTPYRIFMRRMFAEEDIETVTKMLPADVTWEA